MRHLQGRPRGGEPSEPERGLPCIGDVGRDGLPIWNFCGDKDREGTVKASRDMQGALTKAGANSKYTEYPGVGHNCWDDAYRTDALYTWLLEQARSKNKK